MIIGDKVLIHPRFKEHEGKIAVIVNKTNEAQYRYQIKFLDDARIYYCAEKDLILYYIQKFEDKLSSILDSED